MNPPAMALPSSLSFELVRPVGNHTYPMTFTLSNTSGAPQTYAISEGNGKLSFDRTTVSLGAGESAEITTTVVDRGTPAGGQAGTPELVRGYVTVSFAAGDIRIPYLYVIDYNR